MELLAGLWHQRWRIHSVGHLFCRLFLLGTRDQSTQSRNNCPGVRRKFDHRGAAGVVADAKLRNDRLDYEYARYGDRSDVLRPFLRATFAGRIATKGLLVFIGSTGKKGASCLSMIRSCEVYPST